MKVGLIGLGNIGGGCAANLAASALDFYVYDLNRAAAERVLAQGATWSDSCADIAAICDVLFLSLPGPEQIEVVMRGKNGVLAGPADQLVVVDLSTSSLMVARAMYEAAAEKGVSYIDCPVSGGIWGAQSGDLVLMPSGDQSAFDKALPAMQVIGKEDTAYLGESGTGTLVKLINNQIFMAGAQVFQEGYVLATKAGMDIKQLVQMLRGSSAGLYIPLASMVTKRQWEDSTYDLTLAEKDVRLALDTASDLGVDMPMTLANHETLKRAIELGQGDKFFLATLVALEEAAGVTAPVIDVDS